MFIAYSILRVWILVFVLIFNFIVLVVIDPETFLVLSNHDWISVLAQKLNLVRLIPYAKHQMASHVPIFPHQLYFLL